MSDTPNTIELISRMLQACKNIIYATSNLNAPEDIAKDTFALENTDICLSIIIETYNSLDEDEKIRLSVIRWDKIRATLNLLHKQHKTDEDYCTGLYAYKNDLPYLQKKLESRLAEMRYNTN
ncbi:MAG: hypothetical protein J6T96_04200 [Bacteroidales bacterium]|nr:hypothetical protein [Bacteroidales bacterium]MBO7461784.1 hypothetical protein [Bacteroidales bacterium]MBO7567336.1 hypothetical protein [Bacteroidales bacterium]MBP5683180.1 hypothetical protein [Bacteroidales bacterium]